MRSDRTGLFVRLPKQQANALQRLVEHTGRAKQHVLSEMLAERLSAGTVPVGRVEIVNTRDAVVGDVLTLDEAAALLRVPPESVRAAVDEDDLPARRLGEEWRFSRVALLDWLGCAGPRRRGTGKGRTTSS